MQGRVAALKCMQKAQIVASHQERNIMNEKVGALNNISERHVYAFHPSGRTTVLLPCFSDLLVPQMLILPLSLALSM
jgi:hypothetical protein